MSDIGQRLLLKLESLPGILPERAVIEAVSTRVAEWLTTGDGEPTCSVRVKGTLVVASKQELTLSLMVTKPSFQIDDSDFSVYFSLLGGERRSGPSIINPRTPLTMVELPLSDILGGNQV